MGKRSIRCSMWSNIVAWWIQARNVLLKEISGMIAAQAGILAFA